MTPLKSRKYRVDSIVQSYKAESGEEATNLLCEGLWRKEPHYQFPTPLKTKRRRKIPLIAYQQTGTERGPWRLKGPAPFEPRSEKEEETSGRDPEIIQEVEKLTSLPKIEEKDLPEEENQEKKNSEEKNPEEPTDDSLRRGNLSSRER